MLFREPELSIQPCDGLTLRDVTKSDVARIAMLAGEWDVASMTGRIPYPYSESAAIQWIEDLAPGEIVRAIEADGQLIGICGSMPENGDIKSAEIGYWIGKPYWGRGYATSAAHMLKAIALRQKGVERLTSGHFTDNPASARVLQKLGFQKTGPGQCWCEARARNVDAIRYELKRPKRQWWPRPARTPRGK